MTKTFDELLAQREFSADDLLRLLKTTDPAQCARLYQEAFRRTTAVHGNSIFFRGLIEISNVCTYDCRYCGIRKANHAVRRYTLSLEEILEAARYALRAGYGSLALQSGERDDPKFVDFIEGVCAAIHRMSVEEFGMPEGCGMTLSFGEQTPETYERWAQAAGNRTALRYLLRIETSNRKLFAHLHEGRAGAQKTYEARLQALSDLRAAGYQVGTGVMIGIPGQTEEDLVRDILTFKELDVDMLGMGPYLVSHGGDMVDEGMMEHGALLRLTRNMLSTTRLALPTINMAAATALETLQTGARSLGVLSGCNVMMPNVTPQRTRASYQLYDNKQGTESDPDSNVKLEEELVRETGRTIARNRFGSSLHYRSRQGDRPLD